MSDVSGTENEAVEPEAPAFEPPPPPEPVAEEPEPELILGKFKTQDDLVKSYQELEKQFHSRQPEQQPEPEVDPRSLLPPHVDETLWSRVANLAAYDPASAAQWAMQNPNELGPQLTRELVNHWAAQDPSGYMQFLVQSQYANQQQPQMSPGDRYAQEQQVKATYNNAEAKLPEFDRYKDSIAMVVAQREDWYNYLLENGVQQPDGTVQPVTMDDIVEGIYAEIRGKEWLGHLHSQGQTQDTQVDSRKKSATTMTRSTAPASRGEESEEDRYAALIANARGI